MKIDVNSLYSDLGYQQTFLHILLRHKKINQETFDKLMFSLNELKSLNWDIGDKLGYYLEDRDDKLVSIPKNEFFKDIF